MGEITTTVALPTKEFIIFFDSLPLIAKTMKTQIPKDQYPAWREATLNVAKQFIENTDPQGIKDYYSEKVDTAFGVKADAETPTIEAPKTTAGIT